MPSKRSRRDLQQKRRRGFRSVTRRTTTARVSKGWSALARVDATLKIQHYGVPSDALGDDGSLEHLRRVLELVQSLGYTLVEIDPSPFALAIDGSLRQAQLDAFCAVLAQFNLRYSVHAPIRLNLAYDARHELCRRILRSQ